MFIRDSYWTAPNIEFPSREEIIDGLSRQETLYPTSTYFQYSNLGLTLAGEVAATVSNTTYESLIRDRILEPLGLTHTTTEMPAELWGNQLAVGYSAITREGIRKRLPLFQARGISPAAGYASTVEDLGRFASWQFRTLAGMHFDTRLMHAAGRTVASIERQKDHFSILYTLLWWYQRITAIYLLNASMRVSQLMRR